MKEGGCALPGGIRKRLPCISVWWACLIEGGTMIDLWPVLMSPLNPRDLRLAIIIIIIIIITPWRVRVPPRFD